MGMGGLAVRVERMEEGGSVTAHTHTQAHTDTHTHTHPCSSLFSHLGVAGCETLRYVHPRLYGDHHAGSQGDIPVNQHGVMGVQPKVVPQVMWEQPVY